MLTGGISRLGFIIARVQNQHCFENQWIINFGHFLFGKKIIYCTGFLEKDVFTRRRLLIEIEGQKSLCQSVWNSCALVTSVQSEGVFIYLNELSEPEEFTFGRSSRPFSHRKYVKSWTLRHSFKQSHCWKLNVYTMSLAWCQGYNVFMPSSLLRTTR